MYNLRRFDNFDVVEFQWCSEVARGQENPIELVRALETSRTISGLARPRMQNMHGLAGVEISPGGLKTSNQIYEVALTPRNLTAPLKVHDIKVAQSF